MQALYIYYSHKQVYNIEITQNFHASQNPENRIPNCKDNQSRDYFLPHPPAAEADAAAAPH